MFWSLNAFWDGSSTLYGTSPHPFSSMRPYAHASGAASLRPMHGMGPNEHRQRGPERGPEHGLPRTSSAQSTVTPSPMGSKSPADRCIVDQLSETSSQSEDDSEQPITQRVMRTFPRRKASQLVKAPAMQRKSQEVTEFFHLPLHKAASKLGISSTTLKRACRKIGIFQWPYRRLEHQKVEEAAGVREAARKLRLLNPRPAIPASEHATPDCSSCSRNSSPAAEVCIPDHRPYLFTNQPGEGWRDAMSADIAESVRLLAEENRRVLLARQQEEDEDRRLLSQVLAWARHSECEQSGGSNFTPICTNGLRFSSIPSLLNP
jgi:hypothetical protein